MYSAIDNILNYILAIIIATLVNLLMYSIENKHKEGKIGKVTFFHSLTFILFLVPLFILGINILFPTTGSGGLFLAVLLIVILSYIQHLSTSFFNTEVFTSLSQYIIFFIFVVLIGIEAFNFYRDFYGAVLGIVHASLIPIVGFYHFNKSNISIIGLALTILLSLLSPILGLITLGLFYYKGKNAANYEMLIESSLKERSMDMSFIEKILETIKNPKNSMKNIAEAPIIREAVIIIGISTIIDAINGMQALKTFISEGADNIPTLVLWILSIILAGMVGFTTWLLFSGTIHFIAKALGGKGKFYPQMMTVIGYSLIPIFFAGIIGFVLLLMVEPMTMAGGSKEFWESSFAFRSMILGTLAWTWVAIILFFGIQNAHRLTPIKSAFIAVLPLVVMFIIGYTSN